jgi:hypothetical protein
LFEILLGVNSMKKEYIMGTTGHSDFAGVIGHSDFAGVVGHSDFAGEEGEDRRDEGNIDHCPQCGAKLSPASDCAQVAYIPRTCVCGWHE